MGRVTDTPETSGPDYDDVEWHLAEDYPDDLEPAAAGIHIGAFIGWAVLRNLVSETFTARHPDLRRRIEAGQVIPSAVAAEAGGVVAEDQFGVTGALFVGEYFEEFYFDDYVDLSDDELPSIYHEPDTAQKMAGVAEVLDRRLAESSAG